MNVLDRINYNNIYNHIIQCRYEYVYLLGICIISLIFLNVVSFNYDAKEKHLPVIDLLHDKLNTCSIYVKSTLFKKYGPMLRGDNYVVDMPSEENKQFIETCMITTYNIVHYVYYLIVTMICPRLWIELLVICVGFEVYEYYRWNCHDYTDILYNVLGIISGLLIRKHF